MQIVMKIAKSRRPEAVKLVTDLLRQVLPEAEVDLASVEPVFPDVTTGRRAGMMVLSLGDGTSSGSLAKVLDSLRSSDAVEYAQPSSPRTTQAVGGRRS
jgi:hypothetical protein